MNYLYCIERKKYLLEYIQDMLYAREDRYFVNYVMNDKIVIFISILLVLKKVNVL